MWNNCSFFIHVQYQQPQQNPFKISVLPAYPSSLFCLNPPNPKSEKDKNKNGTHSVVALEIKQFLFVIVICNAPSPVCCLRAQIS